MDFILLLCTKSLLIGYPKNSIIFNLECIIQLLKKKPQINFYNPIIPEFIEPNPHLSYEI